MRNVGLTASLLIAGCAMWYSQYHITSGRWLPDFFEVATPVSVSGWYVLLLVVSMLLGIFAGQVHAEISRLSSDQQSRITAIIKTCWGRPGLWKSIVGSPLAFAAVYSLTRSEPDAVIAAILSFQNGFFCDRIIQARAESTKAT